MQHIPPPPQMQSHHPAQTSSETVLRLDANLPVQPNLAFEDAAQMLGQAIRLSAQRPYRHEYIDKPQEGEMHVIFQPVSGLPLPVDGVRYLEAEQRYSVPLNDTVMMEITESKYGFVPGANEPGASRVRKKFRFSKGGHPSVWLVHYTRGPTCVIPPHVANVPVRQYPLVPSNEPAVFVVGEKAGQKVYPGMQQQQQQPQPGYPNQHMHNNPQVHNQTAQVVQQNANMVAMNQRRPPPAKIPGQRRPHEESDDDDMEAMSHRELATLRFMRNHEMLSDIFSVDAPPSPPAPPQAGNDESADDLQAKLDKLNQDIEALNQKIESTKSRREVSTDPNPLPAQMAL